LSECLTKTFEDLEFKKKKPSTNNTNTLTFYSQIIYKPPKYHPEMKMFLCSIGYYPLNLPPGGKVFSTSAQPTEKERKKHIIFISKSTIQAHYSVMRTTDPRYPLEFHQPGLLSQQNQKINPHTGEGFFEIFASGESDDTLYNTALKQEILNFLIFINPSGNR
jgi:hypothetical protein